MTERVSEIIAYLRNCGLQECDAEDIAADIAAAAIEQNRLDERPGYYFVAAKHAANDLRRAMKCKKNHAERYARYASRENPSPADEAVRAENAERVRTTLAAIAEKSRSQADALQGLGDGLTYAMIAERRGVSSATVADSIRRGKKNFQRLYRR